MKISELQKSRASRAIYVPGFTRMSDVIGVLDRSGYGAVIVACGPAALDGVICERDVMRGLALHVGAFLDMQAADVMATGRDTCTAGESVSGVAARMLDRGLSHIAVTTRGRLSDLISLDEIVSAQQEQRRRATRSLAALTLGDRRHAY